MKEIEEVRRENLLMLISECGGQRVLADRVGLSPAQISQWVNRSVSSVTGKPRVMHSSSARRIEQGLGLPANWMDAQHEDGNKPVPVLSPDYIRFELLDGAAEMGPGAVNDDYPEIVRTVEMAVVEVRRRVGFTPKPGRIKLLTGRGESMSPLIEDGDVLMIDTTAIDFSGDGVYLINIAGVTQVKLLQVRPDGIHVISANPAYMPYVVPHAEADTLLIGGKVVSAISIRAL